MQQSLFRAMREAEEAGYLAGSRDSSYMDDYGYDYEDEYDSYGYDDEAATTYGTLREQRAAAIAEVNAQVKEALQNISEKYAGNPVKAGAEIAKIRDKGLRAIADIEAEYGQTAETVKTSSKIAHWAIQIGKTLGIALAGSVVGGVAGGAIGGGLSKLRLKRISSKVDKIEKKIAKGEKLSEAETKYLAAKPKLFSIAPRGFRKSLIRDDAYVSGGTRDLSGAIVSGRNKLLTVHNYTNKNIADYVGREVGSRYVRYGTALGKYAGRRAGAVVPTAGYVGYNVYNRPKADF